MIKYPAEHLRTFTVDAYDWIDNLNFTLSPSECLANHEDYVDVAKEMFSDAGWRGDGDIALMWIPPFVLPEKLQIEHTEGITIWHVKQMSDGVSWILSPDGLYGPKLNSSE